MKAPVVIYNAQQLKKSNWPRSRYDLIFDARANVGFYCVSKNIKKPDGIEKNFLKAFCTFLFTQNMILQHLIRYELHDCVQQFVSKLQYLGLFIT